MTTTSLLVESALQGTPYRNRVVLRGWRLSGPGPARFGWWAVSVAGAAAFLGKTSEAALDFINDEKAKLAVERAEGCSY